MNKGKITYYQEGLKYVNKSLPFTDSGVTESPKNFAN